MADLWNRKQTLEYLDPYSNIYGNGPFGSSYLDQYRNNQVLGWALKGQQDKIDPAVYDNLSGQFQQGKLNAGIGMGTSLIGGIGNLYSQYESNSSINDQSGYYSMLKGVGAVGTGNYNNYGQLANEQQRLNGVHRNTLDDIDGMTGGQKVEALASSTATGAMAGSAFGPVGTAVGAGIGFLTGAGSLLNRQNKAAAENSFGQTLYSQAISSGQENTSAAKDYLDDMNRRRGAVNSAAQGGKIKRQLSMKEFTELVLNKKSMNDVTRSAGIVHSKCKGGTMVRIKVK